MYTTLINNMFCHINIQFNNINIEPLYILHLYMNTEKYDEFKYTETNVY